MEEAKHEKGTKEATVESKALIQRHRVNNNSPGKARISGSLKGCVTKPSIFGKGRKSETDVKIVEIESDERLRHTKKGRQQGNAKTIQGKEETNSRTSQEIERNGNNNAPWGK